MTTTADKAQFDCDGEEVAAYTTCAALYVSCTCRERGRLPCDSMIGLSADEEKQRIKLESEAIEDGE